MKRYYGNAFNHHISEKENSRRISGQKIKIKNLLKIFYLLLIVTFLSGCTVMHNMFAPFSLSSEVEVVENISYKSGSNNPKNKLDLFVPRHIDGTLPVVIFIHGGFWKNQDKRYYRPITGLYWNFGYAFAQQGFVTAVISYRLYPESKIEGQLEDVHSVIEWVKKNISMYHGDPGRINLIGHSAGGHLAAMMGLNQSPEIRSIVSLSPILDIIHMRKNQPADFNQEVVYPIFGKDDDIQRKYSPGELWSDHSVPIKIIVGSKDYGFVLEQSRLFEEKAKTANWKAWREVLSDYEHADLVLSVSSKQAPVITSATDFMRKYNQ